MSTINQLSDVMAELWGMAFLEDESTSETPARVIKAWKDLTWGVKKDPCEPLKKTFKCDNDELVLIKDISFTSICEHHLLPFVGVAHVAYIPTGKVVGLSKIPRCIDILSARPQLQERLTQQVANAILETLSPLGVAVVMEAEHGCMSCRGVKKQKAKTVTSCLKGVFKNDGTARSEFLQLIKG
jgi:GTP cyclohydrolase I